MQQAFYHSLQIGAKLGILQKYKYKFSNSLQFRRTANRREDCICQLASITGKDRMTRKLNWNTFSMRRLTTRKNWKLLQLFLLCFTNNANSPRMEAILVPLAAPPLIIKDLDDFDPPLLRLLTDLPVARSDWQEAESRSHWQITPKLDSLPRSGSSNAGVLKWPQWVQGWQETDKKGLRVH